MSDNEITQLPGAVLDYRGSISAASVVSPAQVTFERSELTLLRALYGRNVAAGEWRD